MKLFPNFCNKFQAESYQIMIMLMIINYKQKKFYQSNELKKELRESQDYSEWNKKTIKLDGILAKKKPSA